MADRTLNGALYWQAMAVRLELALHERELELAQLRHALLRTQIPELEKQCLAALQAPEGATFNWQTLDYDVKRAKAPAGAPPVGP